MALRNIRELGDEILRKKCRTVENIDERIITLLEDMKQTLADSDGIGLAAPQVGVLKRVVVINTDNDYIELINPEIIKTKGTVVEREGCLSVPGKIGYVERPKIVTVKALDRFGNEFEITGKDILARAFCHETDHLDGILFVDKVIKYDEGN